MELQSNRGPGQDSYEFIKGNSSRSYCSKKFLVFVAFLAVVGIVAFVIVLVLTLTGGEEAGYHFEVLPPVQWDGDCPRSASRCPFEFDNPPLLLVSLDGFRPNYLDGSPTLQKLSRCGSTADYMVPVYPSKTFPNHFSIVTGLYPAWHGIIDNFMFDPSSYRVFKLGSEESLDPKWWQGEPIWVTAEKQKKRTATFFWPGSDVEINGVRPGQYRLYDGNVPFETRIDQVLSWLDLPASERPAFITVYFNEPDTAAHDHGTKSNETKVAVARVDAMVERLFSGLQQRNLTDCVNVIILSDHGMADLDCNRTINLDSYINTSEVRAVVGAFGRLKVNKGANTTERDVFGSLRCRSDRMRVFRKEELPVRSHYVHNARIEPLVVDIDSGWTLAKKDSKSKYCRGGNHGYDNLFPDMRATFVAVGPSIKKNTTVRPFLNLELYELMTELLGIVPKPNNGTKGSLHELLKLPRPLSGRDLPVGHYTNYSKAGQGDDKAANCPCTQSVFDMSPEEAERVSAVHLPFGVPGLSPDNSTRILLLHQRDFVVAFSTRLRMPLWASFTLRQDIPITRGVQLCWSGDSRLPTDATARCSDYEGEKEVMQRPLYPPGFSSDPTDALFVSNSVPKSREHLPLEPLLEVTLQEWTKNGPLNVLTGPAFYPLGTEPTVPTHYFLVATSCSKPVDKLSDCSPLQLDARAFLLPNRPFPDNCETADRILGRNMARVSDVEYVTGLRLFPNLPEESVAPLRAAPSPSLFDWKRHSR